MRDVSSFGHVTVFANRGTKLDALAIELLAPRVDARVDGGGAVHNTIDSEPLFLSNRTRENQGIREVEMKGDF
jgi:hypothetical protein